MLFALVHLWLSSAARKYALCGALLALLPVTAWADQSVTLTWNPSPDTNAIGYKIYYGGACRVYTNIVTLGAVTNTTVSGLTEGATYYFSATTLGATGPESAFSNEAIYSIPQTNANPNPVTTGALPTFSVPANMTIGLNSPAQQPLVNNISSGLGDSNQGVTVSATTSDPTIIAVPLVSYNPGDSVAMLTFAPIGIALGTATVTVTVSNGIAGASQSFTVTVVSPSAPPVSVAAPTPMFDALTNLTIFQNAQVQQVVLADINSGLADSNQSVTISATTSDPTIVVPPSVIYNPGDSTGALTFEPVADALGAATVTVTVSNGVASTSQSFTVTVVSPSAPPATTMVPVAMPTFDATTNLTIYPNAGAQQPLINNINSGLGDSNQSVTVSATTSDPTIIAMPLVSYNPGDRVAMLTFAPVGVALGTATVTVTVSNGLAATNQSFTVTVVPVPNRPPTLDAISNVAVLQNAGARTVALTGITSGSPNQSQVLTVAAASDNTNVVAMPLVNYASPNTTGALTFTPVGVGTANVTVTVNNGGAGNNLATQTFSVTVLPATNLPPTLDPIADVTFSAGTPSQAITLTGIGSGSFTNTQLLRVSASSSNVRLISPPTARYFCPASTAVLTLRPMSSASSGTAVITVTVSNGARSNNVVRRSFKVTVVPNQPPTLDPIPNITITNGSGPQTIALAGITSGSPLENQVLRVSASSGNPRLIPTPTIQYASPATTAQLTFRPGSGTGTATITVMVNDGGMNNNSVRQRFSVTVLPASGTNGVPQSGGPGNPVSRAVVSTAAPSVAGTAVVVSQQATLTAVSRVNGLFSFQVNGTPGAKYVVQASSDLINWTAVATNTAPFFFQDTSSAAQRFFRAHSAQ